MAVSYCCNIVRKHDPDRFLLSLLVPACHRESVWALYAFNFEIAKTREIVSETTIGLIRLQWWREAIADIYQGKPPREHEIVSALAGVIKKYNLPQELFDNLIYAREFDLEDRSPASIEGLYNYCIYTNVPLFKLVHLVIGEPINDTDVVDISAIYGLVGILRSTPYMISQRRIMLPQDLLEKNNITERKLFDFNKTAEISNVVKHLLESKQPFRYNVSGLKTPILRGGNKLVALYIQQIKRVEYNLFDAKMAIPPRFMALRVWFSAYVGGA